MKVARVLAVIFAALALSGVEGAAAPARQPSEGRRIVIFDHRTPKPLRLQTLQRLGAHVIKELDLIDALVVSVPPQAAEMENRLKTAPLVLRVDDDIWRANWLIDDEPFTLDKVHFKPSVPRAAVRARQAQSDEAPWGIHRVNAPKAWSVTQGEGVKVAIVDTGIDFNHPDLKANITTGYNAIDPSASAQDDHSHGTHVAGTVAALLDGKGVVGVAPKAKLYAAKVLDANGSGWISDIIAGIDWATQQHVQVLNMSLGGPSGNDSFHEAIKRAVDGGVTVVCAAGNSGPPQQGQASSVGYPAAYPEAIAVAALQEKTATTPETIASFSSRGPEVALIAPGKNVLSTIPGGGYKAYSGTSMASPHVTGLAALAVSRGASSPAEVRAALKAAAKPVAGLSANEQGAGLPDAAAIAGIAEQNGSSR